MAAGDHRPARRQGGLHRRPHGADALVCGLDPKGAADGRRTGRPGFRKGHVCAIFSPNLPDYAIAFHAVSLLGGITTTISPLYTATELGQQLEDAGARC